MRSRILISTIALVATIGLTGCKDFRWPWQKKTTATAGGTVGTGGTGGHTAAPSPITGTDLSTTGGGMGNTGTGSAGRPMLTEDQMKRGQFGVVYFDYDSARIRPSELSKVEAVASALKTTTNKLIIEGHADERGTAEYNRALGEKRAQAVREKLVLLGIDAGRMTTISYGKDKPADMGHGEESWSKNRRVEFVIVSQ